MGASRSEYQLLSPGSTDEEIKGIDSEYVQRDYFARRTFSSRLSLKDVSVAVILLAQSIIILVLLLTKGSQSPLQNCYNGNSSNDHLGQIVYSPAQEALDFEVKVFTTGMPHNNDTSIYQEFTDKGDEAWGALYNHTIFKIPRAQAALLPNRTYPWSQEKEYYIAHLDIFHQLHCLHSIRNSLMPERYASKEGLDLEHLNHCVDSIRQSLMCNPDISVNVWQWSKTFQSAVGRVNTAHSCRNFDKILQWSLDHRLHEWIDDTVYIADDLEIPVIYG